ncbi:MAG: KPN_02809 family neutral zinc metallopeptidase [Nocardioidaceae bacterium]
MGGGGGGLKIGGGIGGIIILILIVLLNGGLPGGGTGTDTGGTTVGGTTDTGSTSSLSQCQTGADANNNESCALVADVNAIQSFWSTELPKQENVRYAGADAVFFSGSTSSGCGEAQSAMGPFYCPVDKHVYLDRSFFKNMLQGELGARGGPFAEAYVLAHEYGHHVQDLLGTMSKVHTQQGPTSDSVRLELQADCFAGIWTKNATTAKDADGNTYIEGLTQDDIARAIDSAKAVGDDAIQKETSGRVNPEQWTHGSSAERVHWFNVGMQDGTIKACDTFSAQSLG